MDVNAFEGILGIKKAELTSFRNAHKLHKIDTSLEASPGSYYAHFGNQLTSRGFSLNESSRLSFERPSRVHRAYMGHRLAMPDPPSRDGISQCELRQDVIRNSLHAQANFSHLCSSQNTACSPHRSVASSGDPVRGLDSRAAIRTVQKFDELPGIERQTAIKAMTSIVRIVMCASGSAHAPTCN
jgi:hypothetical protein